jgi:hypothetical protein
MIQLWRNVAVKSFDAEGTIALGRDRPELLAVARLAADACRPISGRDVTHELLAALPEHVGWLVIDRCVHLGLLVRRAEKGPAEITEGGVLALEHGQVLVPEEGVYRFYIADDPLLPAALVHVAPLRLPNAPATRSALREAKDRGGRASPGTRPPEALRAIGAGRVLLSVVNGSMFEVREPASVGDNGPDGTLRVDLRWDTTGPATLQISGQLPASSEDTGPLRADLKLDATGQVGDLTYDALWTSLVDFATKVPTATLNQWRQVTRKRVLPAPFANVPEAARRAFSLDVEVPAVRFGNLGDFQPTRIQKVDLVPASQADALEWCHWLQWDAVSQGYATPSMLDAVAAGIRARFPHQSPRPMTPQELLMRAQRERADRRSWNLLAPADLGLWSNG